MRPRERVAVSGTSPRPREQVAESLGLRAGLRIWLGGNNADARREIEHYLSETTRPPTGPLDAAFITPNTSDEAVYFAEKLKPRLTPDARVWVVVPRTDNSATQSTTNRMSELVSQVTGAGFTLAREMSFHAGFRGIVFSVAGPH